MSNGDIVSTRRAAELHHVAQSTVRSWVGRGLLKPAITVGGMAFYRLTDVDEAEHQARTRDVTGRARKRTM